MEWRQTEVDGAEREREREKARTVSRADFDQLYLYDKLMELPLIEKGSLQWLSHV